MRRTSTTAFLGVIALTITACGSSDSGQSASPSPTTPPVATNPSPVKPTTPPSPIIARNPDGTAYLAPSLIQPTNANQRVKQVAKGRRDPFAALFAPVSPAPIPVSVAPPSYPTAQAPASTSTTTSRQQASSGSSANNSGSSNGSRRKPNSTVATRNSGATNTSPVRVSAGSQSSPSPSAINPPPPPSSGLPGNNLPPAPPEQLAPELAQNVTVMGVIQIGETAQAIVQVPNEATSRYVQVGQRLSNGQVLVKRIEMNEGAEPLVVLEQYGVEVAKAVGEEPANQNNGQTTPTAALPSPAPQNLTATRAAIPSPVAQNVATTQAASPLPVPQNITTQADAISVPPPPNIPANDGASNQAN